MSQVTMNSRYFILKVLHAAEECLHTALASAQGPKNVGAAAVSTTGLISQFTAAFHQRLTSSMYIAGTAMAPTLNKAGLTNKDAIEKLVIRQIPRPSPRSILVGDIVAFNSPLKQTGSDVSNVMVRRVAALEGDDLVALDEGSDGDDEVVEVPPGHCWLLADNEELKPPQVIDSRTFGHLPLSNVIGRVIYAGSSVHESAPVLNNPVSRDQDMAIIEAEVLPELTRLFDGETK